jgi:hypothetical protein
MTIIEALKIVKNFNRWRRGDIEELIYSPTEIGIAIDLLINYSENKIKGN